MAIGVSRYRVSITAFTDVEPLWGAVLRLLDCGFADDQLCLAGTARALAGLREAPCLTASSRSRLEPLIEHARGLDDWTATMRAPCPEEAPAATPMPVACWLAPRHRGELVQKMSDGAVVLAVSSTNSEQQKASTRILLAMSEDGVQSHEFRLPERAAVPAV